MKKLKWISVCRFCGKESKEHDEEEIPKGFTYHPSLGLGCNACIKKEKQRIKDGK